MDRPKSVDELKCINFREMNLHEKIYIKKLGRPMPDLEINQVYTNGSQRYVRKFNARVYRDNDWICGCDITNALYCFPCILFGGEPAWTKNGVTNLKKMSTKIQKHKNSAKHIENATEFAMLGKNSKFYHMDSTDETDSAHKLSIKQVEENRLVLSKLIDCIKFCGRFDLPVRSLNKPKHSKDLSHSGVLQGLLELISGSDPNVKAHLENTSKFNWNSKSILNEILDCILCITRHQIREEINESFFLSILVSGTSQISQNTQAALIVRYVKNHEIVERFWCFLDPHAQDPASIAECILKELEQMLPNCPEKLIAQSYDGSAMMSHVHLRIREVYPNAVYIHSYAHHLHLVMKKVASRNRKARLFFSNLHGFPAFFSASPQRVAALNATIKRYYPDAPANRWNFGIRTVNKVYEQQMNLLECFHIIKEDTTFTLAAAHAACGLERLLRDKEFNFWLTFFHYLMPHVYVLNNQLSRLTDSLKIKACISEFIYSVEENRKIVEEMDVSSQIHSEEEFSAEEISSLKDAAQEICALIANEIIDRFQFTDHFDITNIFLFENFPAYERRLPQNLIDIVIKNFSCFERDKDKLRSELNILYKRKEFANMSSPLELLQFILENNLETPFSGTVKLLKLILTIPMVTEEKGRCFQTLKCLKKFLRTTKSREHLTAIATLHMEKTMISNVPDFNEKVINLFSSSPARQVDFMSMDSE